MLRSRLELRVTAASRDFGAQRGLLKVQDTRSSCQTEDAGIRKNLVQGEFAAFTLHQEFDSGESGHNDPLEYAVTDGCAPDGSPWSPPGTPAFSPWLPPAHHRPTCFSPGLVSRSEGAGVGGGAWPRDTGRCIPSESYRRWKKVPEASAAI